MSNGQLGWTESGRLARFGFRTGIYAEFVASGALAFDETVAPDGRSIELIAADGLPLAYIIRAQYVPEKTVFVTPPELNQQVGFVVYPRGGEVPRHVHLPLERALVGTSEVLVIRQGRCKIDVYTDHHELVATRELRFGDVMLMVAGGHGFRMLEDTVFLEVKQGPYTGRVEKECF